MLKSNPSEPFLRTRSRSTARGTWSRLKKSKAKGKAEARKAAQARVLELEVPLRNQEALEEKRKRLVSLKSERARRIRAQEVVRGIEHNARVPTFLKLPRNVLDDILYEALLQTRESDGSESRKRKPWEVRVMKVCKALHKHVIASSAMWTFISMAVSGTSRAIQTYLSRSGCMKLHVSLEVCSDDIESLEGYDPRFALLARNIHRIQVLCISCDGYRALNVATIPVSLRLPSFAFTFISMSKRINYTSKRISSISLQKAMTMTPQNSRFRVLMPKELQVFGRG